MHLLLVILLISIVIVVICCCMNAVEGNAELVQNKIQPVNEHKILNYANFSKFIEKKSKTMKGIRLICVIGADLSGRTKLAQLIGKHCGHQVVEDKMVKKTTMGETMKPRKLQDIRREFIIQNVPLDASPSEVAKHKARIATERKKQFVISGNFSDADLDVLFKGKNYNRNFLLLFVQPKEDLAGRWSKLTGHPKEDYDVLLKESSKLLNSYKNHRIYVVKNEFND